MLLYGYCSSCLQRTPFSPMGGSDISISKEHRVGMFCISMSNKEQVMSFLTWVYKMPTMSTRRYPSFSSSRN